MMRLAGLKDGSYAGDEAYRALCLKDFISVIITRDLVDFAEKATRS